MRLPSAYRHDNAAELLLFISGDHIFRLTLLRGAGAKKEGGASRSLS